MVRVEHPFGVIQYPWVYRKVRYWSLFKNTAKMEASYD